MTIERAHTPPTSGPWVQMALFCERVIEEKDSVLSIIRVVDRVIHAPTGPSLPDMMPPFAYQLSLAITLKAGGATGRSTIAIESEGPDGLTRPGPSIGDSGRLRIAEITSSSEFRCSFQPRVCTGSTYAATVSSSREYHCGPCTNQPLHHRPRLCNSHWKVGRGWHPVVGRRCCRLLFAIREVPELP